MTLIPSNDQHTGLPAADADIPSTYLVVPLLPDEAHQFVDCDYFTRDWTPVAADSLSYFHKQTNGNFVKLVRPSDGDIAKHLDLLTRAPDYQRHLLAAVAQTRHGKELLPNVFFAREGEMIIPALFAEGNAGSRALVLVFTKDTGNGFELKATSDPIIKPDPKVGLPARAMG